jgi:hypothetical protein
MVNIPVCLPLKDDHYWVYHINPSWLYPLVDHLPWHQETQWHRWLFTNLPWPARWLRINGTYRNVEFTRVFKPSFGFSISSLQEQNEDTPSQMMTARIPKTAGTFSYDGEPAK